MLMNDLPPQHARDRVQAQLLGELVREARGELEGLRSAGLHAGSIAAPDWHRVQLAAHNIAARAAALRLGVLELCARELEQLAAALATGDGAERSARTEAALVALETIGLELDSLHRVTDGAA